MPFNQSRNSWILNIGYLFFIVIMLSFQKSIQNWKIHLPFSSSFGTKIIGDKTGDLDL